MKQKFIFIRPFYPERMKHQSIQLGLLYLGAVLEKNGYRVKIYDLNNLEITNHQVIKYLEAEKPDFIGVSGLSYDFFGMIELCNLIKQNEKLKIKLLIIGGVHVSSLPEYSLKKTHADIAVIGEAEESIVELLSTINNNDNLKKVKGIGFFENNNYYQTERRPLIENLDSIPFPAWHLIDIKRYTLPHALFLKKLPFFAIITTRGCTFRCTYCASHSFWRDRIRFRSIKNVVDEIEYLIKVYNAKEIQIWDDNFTLKRSYVIEFAKEIARRKIKILFSCPNGVRIDTLDENLLKIMRSIGFYSLLFGVETPSKNIQKIIKKDLKLESVPIIINQAKKLGYFTRASFIIGLPGETINDLYQTLNYSLKLKIDNANFLMFNPLAGSEFFNIWLKNKDIDEVDWSCDYFNKPQSMIGFNTISRKQLKKIRGYIYLRFYFIRFWKGIYLILQYRIKQYKILVDRIIHYFSQSRWNLKDDS